MKNKFALPLNPTQQLAAILAIMSALVTGFNWSSEVLIHLVATLGFGLVLYWFYSTFSDKHKDIWNTVITTLIIFLVLNYGPAPFHLSHLVYPLLAVFIAETQKFFFEFKRSPIINPAVTGLLLMSAIVALIPSLDPAFISWWGAAFKGYLSLAIVAIWIFFGLGKWNKWPMVIAFLGLHALLMLMTNQSPAMISFTFTTSTIYFAASVMLVEPKTSPMLRHEQLVYGSFVAVVYNLLLLATFPYALLAALALGDLAWMMKRVLPK